jgi:hypothetical protein
MYIPQNHSWAASPERNIMEEIDFTLMSNIAEEVEREHEGLLPFTEMVNIMLARYVAAQQPRALDKCQHCNGAGVLMTAIGSKLCPRCEGSGTCQ